MCADGRPYHNAGATEAQELAAVAATALSYLRCHEAAGVALDEAAKSIGFCVAVDADQFIGIAKIKALRRLWSRIAEASGLPAPNTRIHAETAWRMMTRRDPGVNMLRTTVAAFAAGVGGADSLTVLPFTSALGLPDAFARRVARNTQAILLEESNLYRIADPASGSGFVETMTDQLAQSAWRLFQDIERLGGMVAALRQGALHDRIAEADTERRRQIDKRKRPITGTSEFPDIGEKPVAALDVDAHAPPRRHDAAAIVVEPFKTRRLSEPYEMLRDAADDHAKATGGRPLVFLANLGRIADFTARSTWSKNLFEAGGIEAATNDGFSEVDAAARAFADSGAKLACICSSDGIYAELAEPVARALKTAGATFVYLAGKPGDNEASWRMAGIDGFVFAGCDIVDVLENAQDILGVTARPGNG